MSATFHIRPATLAAGDDKRALAFFDSQLEWLESVGSGGQWGSNPRGGNEETQKQYHDRVERSEAFIGKTFSPEWTQAYVLEAEVDANSVTTEVKQLSEPSESDGRVRVPVAAMILESKSPEYVRSVLPERDEDDPFIFLHFLLSDRRTSSINRGSGAALLTHAKEEVRRLGFHRITGDCWAGNDRKLVQYYESQGFKSIGDFVVGEKNWHGTVLEMRF